MKLMDMKSISNFIQMLTLNHWVIFLNQIVHDCVDLHLDKKFIMS